MKILHIHMSLVTGGIEAMINSLANEMAKTHDVSVCSIFEMDENSPFWKSLDPKIRKISCHKQNKGISLKAIFKIFHFLRKEKFEVVHIHGFFYYYALSICLLHRSTRFIYTIHSDANQESAKWDKRLFKLKRLFFRLKWMNAVTISPQSQQSFSDLYKLPSYLIPNGIPLPNVSGSKKHLIEKYRITPYTKIFLHIGRIDRSKNQETLCKCFNTLIKNGHDVVLLIAGPNRDENIFKQISKYFSDRIVYLDAINDSPEYLACVDAFVLPSLWEGLPVTLLEAISVGCIPICSPVGGIPSVIIDGYNGFLSDSPNEDDFLKAIDQFLCLQQDEISTISQRAQCMFTAHYSIEIATKSYIELYQNKFYE